MGREFWHGAPARAAARLGAREGGDSPDVRGSRQVDLQRPPVHVGHVPSLETHALVPIEVAVGFAGGGQSEEAIGRNRS